MLSSCRLFCEAVPTLNNCRACLVMMCAAACFHGECRAESELKQIGQQAAAIALLVQHKSIARQAIERIFLSRRRDAQSAQQTMRVQGLL